MRRPATKTVGTMIVHASTAANNTSNAAITIRVIEKRLDAVQDLVAARDWLAASGRVDPERIGVMGASYGGFMTLAAITDGTTNTLLMGETLDPNGTWCLATTSSIRTNLDRTLNKPILLNGKNYYTYWMSKHPGQVNFINCDGSIRMVTSQINKIVLSKLMTRNGQETISADETR